MSYQLKKKYKFLPLIALLVGLLFTVFIGKLSYEYYKEKERARLELASNEIVLLVKARMETYEQVLRSGVALFDVSDNVTRDAWTKFTKEQKINQNFKGIQGFGYNEVVLQKNKQNFEERMKKEGFLNYTIRPEGYRELYVPVVYIEPFDERNKKALGYDVFSEKARREAMIEAMQSGEAVITGKITLVQENDTDIQSGFVMYLPVYKKGSKLDTPQDRTSSIQGFITAPFRANDLMNGILGTMFPNIDFEIYDGDSVVEKKILYDSNAKNESSIIYKRINLTINNHAWTIVFRTNSILKSLLQISNFIL